MCGVFGFWLRRSLNEEDIALGRRATAMLGHRGPDGQGEWSDLDAGIFLGHRRLTIFDASSRSNQPMRRGSAVITYNGEIYNFPELRSELEAAGEVFTSAGDTEVLLAAWRRWGHACLDRIDGMYAFALFDNDQMHLVTDTFGEKPLYVAETRDGVYFASEAQILVTILGLKFDPVAQEISQFLALGFIPAPGTGFPGMEWLPPSTHRIVRQGRLVSQKNYWSVPRESAQHGKSRVTEGDIDRLADILVRLLRRRLRADVPVGLFLSSGVDSALIGALASREIGMRLESMTVSFSDGVDEAVPAAAIASHLGLPHRVIDSQSGDQWIDMPLALMNMFGAPNDNVTSLSIQHMAELARDRMTVALGGLGGDEVFYGYNKYEFLYRYRWLYRLPQSVFSVLNPAKFLFSGSRRWITFERLLNSGPEERFITLKNREIGEMIRSGTLPIPRLDNFHPKNRDLVNTVREFDLKQTLPASYAAAIDRGGMRAGVEVRTPYLARELFDFAAEFQLSAVFQNGQKTMLRKLLSRYLPKDLVNLRKRGFVFPLTRYLKTVRNCPPKPCGVSEGPLQDLWNRRLEPGYDVIALRLLVLQRFLTGQS